MGKTKQQNKQDTGMVNMQMLLRQQDASPPLFTWTHPKHQSTGDLIKHEGEKIFIRIWSLLLPFRGQQGKRYDIAYESFIHTEWIWIPRGEVYIETEAIRKWHQLQTQKQDTVPDAASHDRKKCLKVCSENSEELVKTPVSQVPLSVSSPLSPSNQSYCFPHAIRRLIKKLINNL